MKNSIMFKREMSGDKKNESGKSEIGTNNTCMTEQEVKIILNQPNMCTLLGLRDRAIMEVLYSTGMRNSEVTELKFDDIDLRMGLARINYDCKWNSQERVVPLSKRACNYLDRYLKKVRPLLDKTGTAEYIFLSLRGGKLKQSQITKMINIYWRNSGIEKKITPYSFRITCIVHMLLNGADMVYLHKLLGQKNIFSNHGDFKHLSTIALKRVHMRYHSGEREDNICLSQTNKLI